MLTPHFKQAGQDALESRVSVVKTFQHHLSAVSPDTGRATADGTHIYFCGSTTIFPPGTIE